MNIYINLQFENKNYSCNQQKQQEESRAQKELLEAEQCTFSPKITSYRLQNRDQPVEEILIQSGKAREQRLLNLRLSTQLENPSFSPELNKKTLTMTSKLNKDSNLYERLYQDSKKRKEYIEDLQNSLKPAFQPTLVAKRLKSPDCCEPSIQKYSLSLTVDQSPVSKNLSGKKIQSKQQIQVKSDKNVEKEDLKTKSGSKTEANSKRNSTTNDALQHSLKKIIESLKYKPILQKQK
ncbi:hypothetical protein pb186bvf_000933 [Paramecium bursaria]